MKSVDVPQVVKSIAAQAVMLQHEIRKERNRVANATRQRDKWKGLANEYRGYISRYQKELAELRTEVKKLRAEHR